MISVIPTSVLLQQGYTILRKLGEGSFASVIQAIDNQTGQHFAIKQIYIQKAFIQDVTNQVKQLKTFKNDHIVKYVDSFYDSQEFYLNLVMELSVGSLRRSIQEKKLFLENELISFVVQMTSAFLILQASKVMHLDLKPQNILIAHESLPGYPTHYKICDFGCSQTAKASKLSFYQTSAFGTYNYLAPQNHLPYDGPKTSSSADVWSLGVTLYQMVFWKLPFPINQAGLIKKQAVEEYFQGRGKEINYESGDLAPKKIIGLIKMMLKAKPSERLSWKGVKEMLIKLMRVQAYEFMDICDVSKRIIQVLGLFLKAIQAAREAQKGKNNLSKLYKGLVHYCFCCSCKLKQKVGYKFWYLPIQDRTKIQKCVDNLQQAQENICSEQDIQVLEANDFDYQECLIVDAIKAYKSETVGFLRVFCDQLSKAIDNNSCLFGDSQVFTQSSYM